MQVTLLGSVSCRVDGTDLPLGGLKQRAVFALLVLDAGRVVSMDRLIDDLWPDDPPAQSTITLRAYISRLRRLLADTPARIETRPPGWLVMVPAGAVDLPRFLNALAEGRSLLESAPDRAAVRLRAALALWSGEALADLVSLPFARDESVRLGELRDQATELLLDAELATGATDTVVDQARRYVAGHPYRERGWRALMLSLYRSGRQPEALAAYAEIRTLLGDELGLDPAPDTQTLHQRILRQDQGLATAVSPVPRADPVLATASPVPDPGWTTPSGWTLVGRDAMVAELETAVRQAAAGRGQLVVIEAPAGAGKSAGLHFLTGRVRAGGGFVAHGNGVGDGAMPALWPWVTIVNELAAAAPDLGVRSDPSPGAASAAFAIMQPGRTDPASATLSRTALYRGVLELLLAARRRHPLAVVIDDAQWLDRDTLALLALAADELVDQGVLFVLAVRTGEEGSSEVERTVQTLRREIVRYVPLPALSREAVAELAGSITGEEPDAGLIEAVRSRTAGNPLFVTELLRLLAAERRLTAEAAYELLPRQIRDVLRRRINRLPTSTVALLTVASLISVRPIDPAILAEVGGAPVEEVLDGCEAALLAGLLVEDGSGFALSHDLVRQTLTADLSDARRIHLHAKIAAALQTRSALGPDDVLEVARHLRLAAPAVGAAAAVPYLISASEDALSRYANDAAEQTLKSAMELVDVIDDPTLRSDLAAQVVGRLLTIGAYTGRAVSELPAIPPVPLDARAAAGWSGQVIAVGVTGHYDWVAEAARRVLDRPVVPVVEGTARFFLGWASLLGGDFAVAGLELGRVNAMVAAGTDLQLPGNLFRAGEGAAGYGALLAEIEGDPDRADVLIAESRRRSGGTEAGLINTCLYVMVLAATRDDPDAARRAADTCTELADRLGFPVFRRHAELIGGWAAARLGEADGAARIDTAYDTYAAGTVRLFLPTYALLRAEVHAGLGAARLAAELAAESARLSRELGEVSLVPRLTALRDRLLGEAFTRRSVSAH